MKVPLTKRFISAVVLAVVLALAVPGSSFGFNSRFIRLADDPNAPQPEASLDYSQPVLLEEDGDESQPEYVPFESGRTYLEEEPQEPQPEFSLRLDEPVLLETEPNDPSPELYPYQL